MTVYAVQQQLRFDQSQRKLVPKFNSIEKANKWGRIAYILSPSANPFHPENALGDIHNALHKFSDEDHLLLIGNPCLIGMCTAVAASQNEGRVKFLQWSGTNSEYVEIITQIF